MTHAESEWRGDVLVFRTGAGEWYNRPDRGRWDMGEDAVSRPPATWYGALEKAALGGDPAPRAVVVDTRELWDLVALDWGFLLRSSKRLRERGVDLVLVGSESTRKAADLLGLGPVLRPTASVRAALESLRPTSEG